MRIFGVSVRLHFTFVLLLAFLVVAGLGGRYSDRIQILSLLGLFASVLLHELGHAMVSRHYGVKVLEIVMYPIGGVSRLEKRPAVRQELWIAAAGPAVNLAIAGALQLTQAPRASVVGQIAVGNLALALFNLLPMFPMDGGRILRSVLALFKPEATASRIASVASRVLAIGLGLYGLVTSNLFLVFIAVFIYVGAAQEGMLATGQVLIQGAPVRAAMVTDFRTLSPGDTIRDAANLLLSTSQQDFPVMLGEQVLGVLGRQPLLRAMAESGPDSYVAGAMKRDFVQFPPDMELADALPQMAEAGNCALVMSQGKLLGLLTGENLAEYLLLRKSGLQT